MSALTELRLTNGEGALVERLAHFLAFMHFESACVPGDRQELHALLARYIKADRREQMRRISELRVSRGESPLPARLLL